MRIKNVAMTRPSIKEVFSLCLSFADFDRLLFRQAENLDYATIFEIED